MSDPIAPNAPKFPRSIEVLRTVFDDGLLASRVTSTVHEVPGADWASITLIDRHGAWTPAASTATARLVDDRQYRLRQGPCLAAAAGQAMVRCDDLRSVSGWPQLSEHAVRLGVRAVLSVRLSISEHHGALNIYARRATPFGTDVEQSAAHAADKTAVAVAGALRVANLLVVLDSRGLIGQAEGILMERFKIDEAPAFELLQRISHDGNIKVRQVAEEVANRGELVLPEWLGPNPR